MTAHTTPESGRWRRWVLWTAGLVVALGAGVATAHGLFEVALAARVPEPIAWLYPLITDGLALVAYVSTARLSGSGRAYAWSVVVLAAGLSGLAQAAYLADGYATAAAALRFGVGAWPAIAAAIVAHLLFLLGTDHDTGGRPVEDLSDTDVQPTLSNPAVQSAVQSSNGQALEPSNRPASNPEHPDPPTAQPGHVRRDPGSAPGSSARGRALKEARRHASLHGSLPTVNQLAQLAQVARGTAGSALKELREQPAQLHVVNDYYTPRCDQ